MLLKRLAFLSYIFLNAFSAYAQQTPTTVTRDPQAVSILTQSLSAAGGVAAISAIQDYTASGTITYNWTDQPIQGPVTVRGKGLTGFRVDATLPAGIQTLAISGLSGRLKTVDGTLKHLAAYNFANAGSVRCPALRLASALMDQTVSVALVGSTQAEGHQK